MTELFDDKLAIWNALETTNPKHTKSFKRSGGFSGTAIKPIYTTLKMTEQFGPAGKGWGMGEPKFEVVPGNDGQVAVYCTVMLWWALLPGMTGTVRNEVWGVGGDMVVVKQTSGLRTDDEAFKKAFTDAIGNAMKHLGMSADVHMGMFDDNKYVQGLNDEFSDKPAAPKQLVKESRSVEKEMRVEVDACATVDELNSLWRSKPFQIEFDKLHQTYKDGLVEMFRERKEFLSATPGKVPTNFENLQK